MPNCLKKYRLKFGFTLEDLEAETGIPKCTLSRFEKEKAVMRWSHKVILANKLKITPAQLMAGDNVDSSEYKLNQERSIDFFKRSYQFFPEAFKGFLDMYHWDYENNGFDNDNRACLLYKILISFIRFIPELSDDELESFGGEVLLLFEKAINKEKYLLETFTSFGENKWSFRVMNIPTEKDVKEAYDELLLFGIEGVDYISKQFIFHF